MNKRNDGYLVKKFPLLYRDRHASMSKSAMHWGFSCGDGWFKLVRDLSKKLETMIVNGKLKSRAAQVKEKFGTLRFYMTGGVTPEMNEEIHRAEALSARTCEKCGKPGKLVKIEGWLYTFCSRCKKVGERAEERKIA